MLTRSSAVVNATPTTAADSRAFNEPEWAALKVLGIHRVLESDLSSFEKEKFIGAILDAAEQEYAA